MSKRSQTTFVKFIASQYRGKPATSYKITKDYGLSLSEVLRLMDACLKNGKLKETGNGVVLGKPIDSRKKPKEHYDMEEALEVTRKQRQPSNQYMAFGWVAGTELTDNDRENLAKVYYKKYGEEPNNINNAGSCILLGPIPAEFSKG